MIGNDIVDLADPQAKGKSRDTRFINRVFTLDEQQKILDSDEPDIFLWSLWAGKETGYKAISKTHPVVSSSPRHYEIKLSDSSLPEAGTVYTPCGPVPVRFFITGEYIHCIGATIDEDVDTIVRDVQEIPQPQFLPDYQSDFVREMARKKISRYLKEDPENIEIIRPKGHRGLGPPVVCAGGERTSIDISMSHAGRFAACAVSGCHGEPSKL